MVRNYLVALMALGAVLVAALPVQAQSQRDYGDIIVAVENVTQGNPNHGYTEYWISIANTSGNDSHEVTVVIPKNAYSRGGNFIRRISRSTVVRPGDTVRLTLWQPPLSMEGMDISVMIDGDMQDDPVRFQRMPGMGGPPGGGYRSVHAAYGTSTSPPPFILYSRSITNDFKDQADRALGAVAGTGPFAPPGGSTGPPGYLPPPSSGAGGPIMSMPGGAAAAVPKSDCQFIRAESPVTSWSTSWLGYSSYDGVVVTNQDMQLMSADVRSTLWRYVECGGTLVVVGKYDVPEPWRSWNQSGRGPASALGLATYYMGFGECLVVSEPDSGRWSPIIWRVLRESWIRSGMPWHTVRDIGRANMDFPILDKMGIPVPGLIVIMVLFAIAIGPVNLLILAHKKKKIWLLWTVPAISLLTCLAVFAYATVAEGWSGHARIQTITILDEAAHRATSIGWAGFYAPLTPRDGLRFSLDTEVTPQVADVSSSYGYRRYSRTSGTARTVEWTQDQHLDSGWVTARVPAHFTVRKNETRRERLAVHPDPSGAPEVTNMLGVDIRDLWLADKQGKLYKASDIIAGQRAVLEPGAGQRVAGTPDRFRQAFMDNWIIRVETLPKSPQNLLMPGSYAAVVDAAPFFEDGLRRAKKKPVQSVVYGIMPAGQTESGE